MAVCWSWFVFTKSREVRVAETVLVRYPGTCHYDLKGTDKAFLA